MFARIVSAAALAGVLSGLLLTALQQIEVAPLLREAELREEAMVGYRVQDPTTNKQHAHEAWAPQDRLERVLATAIANVLLATGFALLLGAAMSLRGRSDWHIGLLWGAAGFAAFFVAPSLGLPPELPGTEVAPLRDRMTWWIGTVIASSSGLWLVVFGSKPWVRALGGLVIATPHVIGAPVSTIHTGIDSDEARAFVRATYVVNAALWVALGGLLGLFSKAGSRRSLNNDCRPARE